MAKHEDQRKREGLGDDQGTRVGRPESEGSRASSGTPTGAGAESTGTPQEAPVEGHDREHRSGYGGHGGAPDRSSNERDS